MTKKLHEEHEEVVHYTSASGLHGIVTSNTLWASHTSFINDNEEVVGFFSRVLPMILRPVFEGYVAESKDLKKRVQDAYQLGVDLFDHWLKRLLTHSRRSKSGRQITMSPLFVRQKTHGYPNMAY